MIIYIPMASASTTIIIATKPLPSNIVLLEAKEYVVPLGEDFLSKRLPVISDWLYGTRINDADVEMCFIDKNIKNDELEVMMILEDKRLTLSSLSVDTNCSFLDISNYRILQGFNDSLGSIVKTTSNNSKTLENFTGRLDSFENETSRTLENFTGRLDSFENEMKKFQSTSDALNKTSYGIHNDLEKLEQSIDITLVLLSAILFTLIGLFIVVGRHDTRKRRR